MRLLNKQYKELRKKKNKDGKEEIMRLIIEEERRIQQRKIEKVTNMIKGKKGNVNGAGFWELNKKLGQRKKETRSTAINDEKGERVEKDEEIRKRYKEFYEDLLKPQNPRNEEEENIGNRVNEKKKEIQERAQEQKMMEITTEDVKKTIKTLKKRKAKDRSEVKNEMMIEGGEEMEKSLMRIFTEISKELKVPEEWNLVKIKSIHKKGSTLEMKNRRGIFITSNISKAYERILLRKIEEQRNTSIFQNGAKKGRSVVDNLLATMMVIDYNKRLNIPTYLIFADAVKCFDRLWLKDCLKDLAEGGVREREVAMVLEMNKKAKIEVDTPVGITEEFEEREIVKQGTVIGPVLCCGSSEKVNSVGETPITHITPNLQTQGLIYVDDISGAGSRMPMEKLLQNLRKMEEEKRFLFSIEKTKIMKIKGRKDEELRGWIRQGEVKRCKEYKNLGIWMNEKGNMERELEEYRARAKKIIANINVMASRERVGEAEIATKLYLYISMGRNAIFNNVEVWTDYNKAAMEEIDRINIGAIKKLIGMPKGTPTYGILAELGMWSMDLIILYKKLMLLHNIENTKGERLAKKIVEEQKRNKYEGDWYGGMKGMMQRCNVKVDMESIRESKSKWKRRVKKEMEEKMIRRVEREKDKRKMRFIKEYGRKEYIKMKPEQVRLIMRGKMNMIPVRDNYGERGECRLCGKGEETTEHVFKCIGKEEKEVDMKETKDREKLGEIARRAKAIIERLEEMEKGKGREN